MPRARKPPPVDPADLPPPDVLLAQIRADLREAVAELDELERLLAEPVAPAPAPDPPAPSPPAAADPKPAAPARGTQLSLGGVR